MALRTLPRALEQARVIESIAPDAWLNSFANPAGLITQALSAQTGLKLIGICDTPSEMFHRIARALNEKLEDVHCDYFGLNHLGWVGRVTARGADVTQRLIDDDAALRSLYHADPFDPAMIRALGLIPSEYLFFYYEPRAVEPAQGRRDSRRRGGEARRRAFQPSPARDRGVEVATGSGDLQRLSAPPLRIRRLKLPLGFSPAPLYEPGARSVMIPPTLLGNDLSDSVLRPKQ
jgi:hypothetical protein